LTLAFKLKLWQGREDGKGKTINRLAEKNIIVRDYPSSNNASSRPVGLKNSKL